MRYSNGYGMSGLGYYDEGAERRKYQAYAKNCRQQMPDCKGSKCIVLIESDGQGNYDPPKCGCQSCNQLRVGRTGVATSNRANSSMFRM